MTVRHLLPTGRDRRSVARRHSTSALRRVILALVLASAVASPPALLEPRFLPSHHVLAADSSTFSDAFTRADNANLGSNWSSGYTSSCTIEIASNQARPNSNAIECIESVNAVSYANNQWGQVQIATFATDTDEACILLRTAAPATLTYYYACALKGLSITSVIGVNNAGTPTDLVTENATTWAATDTVKARANGTTIELYRNGGGSPLLSTTDSVIASGRVGLLVYGGTSDASSVVDNFDSGDIVAGRSVIIGGGVFSRRHRVPQTTPMVLPTWKKAA